MFRLLAWLVENTFIEEKQDNFGLNSNYAVFVNKKQNLLIFSLKILYFIHVGGSVTLILSGPSSHHALCLVHFSQTDATQNLLLNPENLFTKTLTWL